MDSTTCPPPADPVNATDGQPESLPPVVGTTDDASNGDGTIAVQDDADLQTAGIALEEPGAKLEAAEPNEAKPVERPGPPPDGGYGWVIVLSSFLMQAFTFAPYQRYFLTNQTFGPTSNLQLAFISSISSAMTFLAGPFVGRFTEVAGFRVVAFCGAVSLCVALELASLSTQIWHMYLTFGVMGGIGISMSYIPSAAVVPQWFSKRLGLALGISVSGGGIGGLILNPLIAYLLENLGWQWSLRICGFMTGAIGLVGCSLMRARLPPTKRKGGILSAFDFHRFKDFTFVRVYCMCIISGLGFFSVWIFLSTFGGSIGISPENAALIVGLGNGMAAIGRVVSGATSDKLGAMNMWLLNFFVAALAVLLIWTNASNFGLLLFFSLVFGWAGGSYTSLYALNMAHLYGSAGQAALLGLLYTALIPGSLLGAPIGGAILDSTATIGPNGEKVYQYLGLQLYSGFTQLAGACLLLWVRLEYGAKKAGSVAKGIPIKI